MRYLCADRGSRRCPCILMEAGKCYTCTMVRDGVCSCEDQSGWQGVCPYTEYCQLGGAAQEAPEDCMTLFDVMQKTSYGPDIHAVGLSCSRGFMESCRRPGAYVMAEALGWRTPVSLLRTGMKKGICRVEFLLKESGPKTAELARMADEEKVWKLAGPYYNGLLHSEEFYGQMLGKKQEENLKNAELTVIARGTAAAPFFHLRDLLPEAGRKQVRLYLDDEMLPEDFCREYLKGMEFERIRLSGEEDLKRMKALAEARLRDGNGWIAVLASPYYLQQILAGLDESEKNRVIVPNQANLCCGMGICGSCSCTDGDGVTVKLCKCSQAVVE